MSEAQPSPQPNQTEQKFVLHRIYLKDLSFESPASPRLFSSDWRPQIQVEINTQHEEVQPSVYEVVIHFTLTAKQESKTVLLIELQQAGLFEIGGIQEQHVPQVLKVACPTILFPYLRETVDTLALKGSVPPLLLAPIDFQALQQKIERAGAEST